MEAVNLFLVTFAIVFVGELGDKSQMVAAVAALTNRKEQFVVFAASALALTLVAGVGIYLTAFIPTSWLPWLTKLGGAGLILYGIYLFWSLGKAGSEDGGLTLSRAGKWALFGQLFSFVATHELGDKTQVASLGIALANPDERFVVFVAAAAALTCVSGLTVWLTKFVPLSWSRKIQTIGSFLLVSFGLYMIVV